MIVDPVVIVGAGPVGLTLSLALAHNGVTTLVLDGEPPSPALSPPRPARTAVLRPATEAFLARLGCAPAGLRLTAWRATRGADPAAGRTLRQVAYEAPGPLHVPQQPLVDALRAAVAAHDLATLVPDARVDTLEQEAAGVSVRTRAAREDAKPVWWRGSYAVGCDGARSAVRKLLAVPFPGRTAVERHAVAAIRTELPWAGGSGEAGGTGGTVLCGAPSEVCARPLPGGVWRLDWLLPPDAGLVTPEALTGRVEGTLAAWGGGPYELLDTGVHTVHHRLARSFRSGRVLLAGDAAHLHGALGAQQLDEGLQDAENLAWRLAAALRRPERARAVLGAYETERRGVLGQRLRAADQALALVRRRSGEWRRGQALTLLTDGHLGRGPLGAPLGYATPPPVPSLPVGTALGAPAAQVEVIAPDGRETSLHACLGRSVVVVLIAPGTRVWRHGDWLTAGLMPALLRTVAELPVEASLVVAEEYPGAPAHSVLVVRPDGRLAAVLPGGDTAALRACVESLGG
ncbi:FAD-dependent oxidoreductase [Streptomyces polyrhachis]|uniref:FAD-dependent oxidoreductase n=1 Tax=Streptomyces polyrhachis TaxID=1282885 RepID=A0ABW2GFW3_9ACTN